MTTRVLPVEEWSRLAGTEAGGLDIPHAARVVVVEDGGAIVGCHILVPVLHAECLWIHPAHRGRSSVARRLWAAVRREVSNHFQVGAFATAAASDDVRRLLDHVGATRIEADFYMVPVRG